MSFWCHRFDQNSNKNIVRISALKFFVASWGLPGDLVSNIINKEAYKKPQGNYKKFQGRNLDNVFVILVQKLTPKRYFEINWPLPQHESQHPSTFSLNVLGIVAILTFVTNSIYAHHILHPVFCTLIFAPNFFRVAKCFIHDPEKIQVHNLKLDWKAGTL